jgi:Polyphosphate kinase 2 (PPK2)
LHITPAEQTRRFKERLTNPLKRWKLSYEDFRNRSRWADYEAAIEDMMEKTSPTQAPWYLIPTNDKLYGRLAVFTILTEVLGKGLRLKPRPLDPKVVDMAKHLTLLKRPTSSSLSALSPLGNRERLLGCVFYPVLTRAGLSPTRICMCLRLARAA